MAFDVLLATRMRAIFESVPGLEEKKMFGGVGFLFNGNMACGVHKDNLIIRVGPANYEEALSNPYTKVFDFTGKPMAGWIMVNPQGSMTESDLKYWIDQGVKFALSLPGK